MKRLKSFLSRIILFYWKYITSPQRYARHIGVKIGTNCFIDTRNWSSEPYLITIGNNCQVTHCVSIHTHGGGQCVRDQYPEWDCFGKVVIEDWAYIGAYSQIMPGVTIGHHSLVAAGSVVTKSVPPHTVVGGNPARVLCTTQEFIERNRKYNINSKNWPDEKKDSYLLSMDDSLFIKK